MKEKSVFMNSTCYKKSGGITLIALIITIIVMLILAAVTITVVLNGGLFEYAGRAADKTNKAIEDESNWTNVSSGLTMEELIDYFTEDKTDNNITFYIQVNNKVDSSLSKTITCSTTKNTTWLEFINNNGDKIDDTYRIDSFTFIQPFPNPDGELVYDTAIVFEWEGHEGYPVTFKNDINIDCSISDIIINGKTYYASIEQNNTVH